MSVIVHEIMTAQIENGQSGIANIFLHFFHVHIRSDRIEAACAQMRWTVDFENFTGQVDRLEIIDDFVQTVVMRVQ